MSLGEFFGPVEAIRKGIRGIKQTNAGSQVAIPALSKENRFVYKIEKLSGALCQKWIQAPMGANPGSKYIMIFLSVTPPCGCYI